MLLKSCNFMYSRMDVYTERDREGFSVGARHILLLQVPEQKKIN